MTTKIQAQKIVEHTNINGHDVRTTMLNKRKFYFLKDLYAAYGKSVVDRLNVQKTTLRFVAEGSSQLRGLVNVSEFKDALRKYKENNKKSFTKVLNVRAPRAKTLDTVIKEAKVSPSDDIDLSPCATVCTPACAAPQQAAKVETKPSSTISEENYQLKKKINKMVEEYATNKTKTETNANKRLEVLKTTYCELYEQFDRALANTLGIDTYDLNKFKLGLRFRPSGKDSVSYITRVLSANQLPLLHSVAVKLCKI